MSNMKICSVGILSLSCTNAYTLWSWCSVSYDLRQ